MASCRREGALDSFSPELIVFQPNMVPCCPEGYQCKRMHDLEHTAAYQHPPPYHGESIIMGGSEHPEDQYEDELATLRHTGFSDDKANLEALRQHDGDWKGAIKALLDRERPWACLNCTLKNEALKLACEACGSTRPAPETIAAVPGAEDWMATRGTKHSGRDEYPCFAGAARCTPVMGWHSELPRLHALPHHSSVVVYVHGFSQPYKQAQSVLDTLAAPPEHDNTHGAPAQVVMAFLWPAHTYAYHRAKSDTIEAAKRLQHLLEVLVGHGNRVHLLGHSLGARVCLGALDDWTHPLMGDCFLLGAALTCDALAEEGEFPAHRCGATTVHVYHSVRDPVLPSLFAIAEHGLSGLTSGALRLQAMGLVGVLAPVPKVSCVDVSDVVDGHGTKTWFLGVRCHVMHRLATANTEALAEVTSETSLHVPHRPSLCTL